MKVRGANEKALPGGRNFCLGGKVVFHLLSTCFPHGGQINPLAMPSVHLYTMFNHMFEPRTLVNFLWPPPECKSRGKGIYYTILYYTILLLLLLLLLLLYYTILYYTILYYTILYYNILYYTILYYDGGGAGRRHLPRRAPEGGEALLLVLLLLLLRLLLLLLLLLITSTVTVTITITIAITITINY